MADKALEEQDYLTCYEFCAKLMDACYIPIWTTCHHLAVQSEFKSELHKKRLLAFAVCYCDAEMVMLLLEKKLLVESQVLYKDLTALMYHEDNEEDNEEEDVVKTADTTFEESEYMDTTEMLEPEKDIKETSPLAAEASQALMATSAMLSTVTDVGWWTKSLQTLATQISTTTKEQLRSKNFLNSPTRDSKSKILHSPMDNQGCHPFYEGCVTKPQLDHTFMNVETLRSEDNFDNNPDLVLEEKLVRKAALEACFTDGASLQNVDEILLPSALKWLENDVLVGLAFLFVTFDASIPGENLNAFFDKLPSNKLSYLLTCYFYSLLNQHSKFDLEIVINPERLETLLKEDPLNIIKKMIYQGNLPAKVLSNLELLKEMIQEQVPPLELENVKDKELLIEESSTSEDSAIDQLLDSDNVYGASHYLLSTQPHHRMISTLTSGIGMLRAFATRK